MDFFIEYLGEFILLFGAAILSLFGKKESAKKLLKKTRKAKMKQEKKVAKEAKKLEEDLEVLKSM